MFPYFTLKLVFRDLAKKSKICLWIGKNWHWNKQFSSNNYEMKLRCSKQKSPNSKRIPATPPSRPPRGSDVLEKILGTVYSGIISCDFFSAYQEFAKKKSQATLQLCWAHLIREIKYISESKNKCIATRSDWGNRWWERIWSVLSTCEQQGKGVMEFLKSCVRALLQGSSALMLVKCREWVRSEIPVLRPTLR